MTTATLSKKELVREELRKIEEANNGILRPVDVVTYARKNKRSALHGEFTWDNNKAAEEYRLWQARQVIRVHVEVIKPDTKPIRAFVSLIGDRANPGGGYRAINAVLSNKEQREQLVEQATREFKALRQKWKNLTELADIFAAIDAR